MRFSVIVPIYNAEKYLSECIESILNQDFTDFELILVNDGSPDNSRLICENYAKKDSRVKLINKENGGVSSARTAGANLASGDYIILIDGDDYIEQGYFSCADRIISKYEPDIISFGYIRLENGLKRYIKNPQVAGIYKDSSLKKIADGLICKYENGKPMGSSLFWTLWTNVYRREIYVKSQNYVNDRTFADDDSICNTIAFHNAKSLYVCDKIYYNYRVLESSVSHSYSSYKFKLCDYRVQMLLSLDYIEKRAIDYYAYNSLITLLSHAARFVSCYAEFKKIAEDSLNNIVLWKEAKSFKPKNISVKERLKIFCIRTENFFLIYMYFKYFMK